MDDNIKVGITTACYNSEKTIHRTIESVLNQTYSNIEYIIIDGNSNDRTVQIAESYREQFRNKGYQYIIISEKDQGMYDAINKGIRLSNGELMGNVNSDDYYEPEAVEKMVDFYRKVNYDVAWGDDIIHTQSGRTYISKAKRNKYIWTTSGWIHPTMFAKRDILIKFPYACETMYDDFDFITAVYVAGKKICLINEPISNFSLGCGMSGKKGFRAAMDRVWIVYGIYRKYGMSRLYFIQRFCFEMIKMIYLWIG